VKHYELDRHQRGGGEQPGERRAEEKVTAEPPRARAGESKFQKEKAERHGIKERADT